MRVDVIVVGAGVAGLSAARALSQAGRTVLVLEACEMPGGRVKAVPFGEDTVQLGAFLLHTLDNNPLVGRYFDADQVVPFKEGPLHIYEGEQRLSPAIVRRHRGWIRQALWQLHRQIDLVPPLESVQDRVFATVLEMQGEPPHPQVWQAVLERWTNVEGEEPDMLSLVHLLQNDGGGGGDAYPPGGMYRLVESLVEGLDIRTQTPVTAIDWRESTVVVRAGEQAFEADQVLVTLPLGVLRSEVVQFQPQLPDYKRDAMRRMGFGLLNKIMLYYETPFWKPGARSWSLQDPLQTQSIAFTTFCHPDSKILTVFVGGNRARTWEHLTDEQLTGLLVDRLRTCLGNHIGEPDAILRTMWGQNPYALGGYSYLPCDAYGDEMTILAEPLQDRLFFAGEACIRSHYGTVHGAYLSGLNAANLMTRDLRADLVADQDL